MSSEVWKKEIDLYFSLWGFTIFSVILFFFFTIHVFIDSDYSVHDMVSISSEMDMDKRSMITYTLILYMHTYALSSYLIMMTNIWGRGKNQFALYVIGISCVLYSVCLVTISYLPTSTHSDQHNLFAISAFFFAGVSLFAHDFNTYHYWVRGETRNISSKIMIFECVYLILFIIFAIIFWVKDIAFFEYLCAIMVLLDKWIKMKWMVDCKRICSRETKMIYIFLSPTQALNTGY